MTQSEKETTSSWQSPKLSCDYSISTTPSVAFFLSGNKQEFYDEGLSISSESHDKTKELLRRAQEMVIEKQKSLSSRIALSCTNLSSQTSIVSCDKENRS